MDPRDAMIAELAADARDTALLTGRSGLHPKVIAALRDTPREEFVPPGRAGDAYANRAMPIGCGQTISQPFVVALMTDLLELDPGSRVLEIGTGSGYQAAILSRLADRVFSIEVIPPLAERARAALQRTGCGNVVVREGDGALGWPEEAPFDAVIVTAAAPLVPPILVGQLRPGGRMVLPLDKSAGNQDLSVVRKAADGAVSIDRVLPVAFVPFTGAGIARPGRAG